MANAEPVQDPLPGMEGYERTKAERTLELRQRNQRLLQEMDKLHAGLDAGAVAMLFVQALTDVTCDDETRADVELLFESRMADALRETVTHIRRQKITSGTAVSVNQGREPNTGGLFIGPA